MNANLCAYVPSSQKPGEEEDLKDAVMSVVADSQLAEWLVCGCIAGINSKEEEERVVKEQLSNYCPGIEAHVTEVYSKPRVTKFG